MTKDNSTVCPMNKISKSLLFIFAVALTTTAIMAFKTISPASIARAEKWTTGIALYSFNRHSFRKALFLSKASEVKYVEGFSFHNMGIDFAGKTLGSLDATGISLMKRMLKENDLAMSSIYVSDAKNAAEWKTFFDMGRELGVKYLVCEPAKSQWGTIDSLAGIYNIKIAIHEHKKGSSIYWHPDSVLAAIKGHKNIGACADIGHWVRSGLDPVKCLKMLDGHIIGLHLKDIDKADHETDVDLGTGSIDYPAVVKELRRQKFAGYAHVECEHNMEDNQPIVKAAVQYFNKTN